MGTYRQIDAAAVQNFAHRLREFQEATSQQLQSLITQLTAMNSNGEWRDENYDRYYQEFEPAARMIHEALSKFRDEQEQALHQLIGDVVDLRYQGR